MILSDFYQKIISEKFARNTAKAQEFLRKYPTYQSLQNADGATLDKDFGSDIKAYISSAIQTQMAGDSESASKRSIEQLSRGLAWTTPPALSSYSAVNTPWDNGKGKSGFKRDPIQNESKSIKDIVDEVKKLQSDKATNPFGIQTHYIGPVKDSFGREVVRVQLSKEGEVPRFIDISHEKTSGALTANYTGNSTGYVIPSMAVIGGKKIGSMTPVGQSEQLTRMFRGLGTPSNPFNSSEIETRDYKVPKDGKKQYGVMLNDVSDQKFKTTSFNILTSRPGQLQRAVQNIPIASTRPFNETEEYMPARDMIYRVALMSQRKKHPGKTFEDIQKAYRIETSDVSKNELRITANKNRPVGWASPKDTRRDERNEGVQNISGSSDPREIVESDYTPHAGGRGTPLRGVRQDMVLVSNLNFPNGAGKIPQSNDTVAKPVIRSFAELGTSRPASEVSDEELLAQLGVKENQFYSHPDHPHENFMSTHETHAGSQKDLKLFSPGTAIGTRIIKREVMTIVGHDGVETRVPTVHVEHLQRLTDAEGKFNSGHKTQLQGVGDSDSTLSGLRKAGEVITSQTMMAPIGSKPERFQTQLVNMLRSENNDVRMTYIDRVMQELEVPVDARFFEARWKDENGVEQSGIYHPNNDVAARAKASGSYKIRALHDDADALEGIAALHFGEERTKKFREERILADPTRAEAIRKNISKDRNLIEKPTHKFGRTEISEFDIDGEYIRGFMIGNSIGLGSRGEASLSMNYATTYGLNQPALFQELKDMLASGAIRNGQQASVLQASRANIFDKNRKLTPGAQEARSNMNIVSVDDIDFASIHDEINNTMPGASPDMRDKLFMEAMAKRYGSASIDMGEDFNNIVTLPMNQSGIRLDEAGQKIIGVGDSTHKMLSAYHQMQNASKAELPDLRKEFLGKETHVGTRFLQDVSKEITSPNYNKGAYRAKFSTVGGAMRALKGIPANMFVVNDKTVNKQIRQLASHDAFQRLNEGQENPLFSNISEMQMWEKRLKDVESEDVAFEEDGFEYSQPTMSNEDKARLAEVARYKSLRKSSTKQIRQRFDAEGLWGAAGMQAANREHYGRQAHIVSDKWLRGQGFQKAQDTNLRLRQKSIYGQQVDKYTAAFLEELKDGNLRINDKRVSLNAAQKDKGLYDAALRQFIASQNDNTEEYDPSLGLNKKELSIFNKTKKQIDDHVATLKKLEMDATYDPKTGRYHTIHDLHPDVEVTPNSLSASENYIEGQGKDVDSDYTGQLVFGLGGPEDYDTSSVNEHDYVKIAAGLENVSTNKKVNQTPSGMLKKIRQKIADTVASRLKGVDKPTPEQLRMAKLQGAIAALNKDNSAPYGANFDEAKARQHMERTYNPFVDNLSTVANLVARDNINGKELPEGVTPKDIRHRALDSQNTGTWLYQNAMDLKKLAMASPQDFMKISRHARLSSVTSDDGSKSLSLDMGKEQLAEGNDVSAKLFDMISTLSMHREGRGLGVDNDADAWYGEKNSEFTQYGIRDSMASYLIPTEMLGSEGYKQRHSEIAKALDSIFESNVNPSFGLENEDDETEGLGTNARRELLSAILGKEISKDDLSSELEKYMGMSKDSTAGTSSIGSMHILSSLLKSEEAVQAVGETELTDQLFRLNKDLRTSANLHRGTYSVNAPDGGLRSVPYSSEQMLSMSHSFDPEFQDLFSGYSALTESAFNTETPIQEGGNPLTSSRINELQLYGLTGNKNYITEDQDQKDIERMVLEGRKTDISKSSLSKLNEWYGGNGDIEHIAYNSIAMRDNTDWHLARNNLSVTRINNERTQHNALLQNFTKPDPSNPDPSKANIAQSLGGVELKKLVNNMRNRVREIHENGMGEFIASSIEGVVQASQVDPSKTMMDKFGFANRDAMALLNLADDFQEEGGKKLISAAERRMLTAMSGSLEDQVSYIWNRSMRDTKNPISGLIDQNDVFNEVERANESSATLFRAGGRVDPSEVSKLVASFRDEDSVLNNVGNGKFGKLEGKGKTKDFLAREEKLSKMSNRFIKRQRHGATRLMPRGNYSFITNRFFGMGGKEGAAEYKRKASAELAQYDTSGFGSDDASDYLNNQMFDDAYDQDGNPIGAFSSSEEPPPLPLDKPGAIGGNEFGGPVGNPVVTGEHGKEEKVFLGEDGTPVVVPLAKNLSETKDIENSSVHGVKRVGRYSSQIVLPDGTILSPEESAKRLGRDNGVMPSKAELRGMNQLDFAENGTDAEKSEWSKAGAYKRTGYSEAAWHMSRFLEDKGVSWTSEPGVIAKEDFSKSLESQGVDPTLISQAQAHSSAKMKEKPAALKGEATRQQNLVSGLDDAISAANSLTSPAPAMQSAPLQSGSMPMGQGRLMSNGKNVVLNRDGEVVKLTKGKIQKGFAALAARAAWKERVRNEPGLQDSVEYAKAQQKLGSQTFELRSVLNSAATPNEHGVKELNRDLLDQYIPDYVLENDASRLEMYQELEDLYHDTSIGKLKDNTLKNGSFSQELDSIAANTPNATFSLNSEFSDFKEIAKNEKIIAEDAYRNALNKFSKRTTAKEGKKEGSGQVVGRMIGRMPDSLDKLREQIDNPDFTGGSVELRDAKVFLQHSMNAYDANIPEDKKDLIQKTARLVAEADGSDRITPEKRVKQRERMLKEQTQQAEAAKATAFNQKQVGVTEEVSGGKDAFKRNVIDNRQLKDKDKLEHRFQQRNIALKQAQGFKQSYDAMSDADKAQLDPDFVKKQMSILDKAEGWQLEEQRYTMQQDASRREFDLESQQNAIVTGRGEVRASVNYFKNNQLGMAQDVLAGKGLSSDPSVRQRQVQSIQAGVQNYDQIRQRMQTLDNRPEHQAELQQLEKQLASFEEFNQKRDVIAGITTTEELAGKQRAVEQNIRESAPSFKGGVSGSLKALGIDSATASIQDLSKVLNEMTSVTHDTTVAQRQQAVGIKNLLGLNDKYQDALKATGGDLKKTAELLGGLSPEMQSFMDSIEGNKEQLQEKLASYAGEQAMERYADPYTGERQQATLMDILGKRGYGGEMARKSQDYDELKRTIGIDVGFGQRLKGGKDNAIGDAVIEGLGVGMRGVKSLQGTMFATMMASNQVAKPMMDLASGFESEQIRREAFLMSQGGISADDMMSGTMGQARRRRENMNMAKMDAGEEIYRTFSPLFDQENGSIGRNVGSLMSWAGPALGAAMIGAQVGGPLAGLAAGAVAGVSSMTMGTLAAASDYQQIAESRMGATGGMLNNNYAAEMFGDGDISGAWAEMFTNNGMADQYTEALQTIGAFNGTADSQTRDIYSDKRNELQNNEFLDENQRAVASNLSNEQMAMLSDLNPLQHVDPIFWSNEDRNAYADAVANTGFQGSQSEFIQLVGSVHSNDFAASVDAQASLATQRLALNDQYGGDREAMYADVSERTGIEQAVIRQMDLTDRIKALQAEGISAEAATGIIESQDILGEGNQVTNSLKRLSIAGFDVSAQQLYKNAGQYGIMAGDTEGMERTATMLTEYLDQRLASGDKVNQIRADTQVMDGLIAGTTSQLQNAGMQSLTYQDLDPDRYNNNMIALNARAGAFSQVAQMNMASSAFTNVVGQDYLARNDELLQSGQLFNANVYSQQLGQTMGMYQQLAPTTSAENRPQIAEMLNEMADGGQERFADFNAAMSGNPFVLQRLHDEAVARGETSGLASGIYNQLDMQTGRSAYQGNISAGEEKLLREFDYGGQLADYEGSFAGIDTDQLQRKMQTQQYEFQDQQYAVNRNMRIADFAMETGGQFVTGRVANPTEEMKEFTDQLDSAAGGLQTVSEIFEKFGLTYKPEMSNRAIQDEQIALQRGQQLRDQQMSRADLGLSEQGMQLRWRQFFEQMDLSREKFGYETNQQRGDMALDRGMQLTQRSWQREDMSVQRNQAELGFGWQMEDFDLQLRYARGMDRRNLMRQQERAVISQSMERAKMDRQEDRFEVSAEFDDTKFTRAMANFEQMVAFQQQSMDMQERHFREQFALDEEKFNMQRQRTLEDIGIQNRQWELQQMALENNRAEQEMQYETSLTLSAQQQELTLSLRENGDLLAGIEKAYGNIQAKLNLVKNTTEGLTNIYTTLSKQVGEYSVNTATVYTETLGAVVSGSMKFNSEALIAAGDSWTVFITGIQQSLAELSGASGGSAGSFTPTKTVPIKSGGTGDGGTGGGTWTNFSKAEGGYIGSLRDLEQNAPTVSFAKGGYTGDGFKYQSAGVGSIEFHAGEYVVPQRGVPVVRGDNPESTEELRRIRVAMEKLVSMGMYNINANISTNEGSVKVSQVTALLDQAYQY